MAILSTLQPLRPLLTLRGRSPTTLSILNLKLRPRPTKLLFNHPKRPIHSSPTSSRLTPQSLFTILLGANLLPFSLYWYSQLTQSRPLLSWLEKNFLLTPSSAPATYLTSGFFHTSPFHLAFNMLTLRALVDILALTSSAAAAPVLLATHLAGIVAGSVAMRTIGPLAPDAPSGSRRAGLGASGGVSALLVAAALRAPGFPVNVMFIPINIPLAVVAGGYLLFDARFANDSGSTIGHAAHLGGGVVGAAAWLLLLRGR
ncbi:hypothetical protein ANO11243_011660 [Dothideomycetidae sp. 11243]|nr:hypothetical protein ANO11243_011660 [fungal sp. No.11243]